MIQLLTHIIISPKAIPSIVKRQIFVINQLGRREGFSLFMPLNVCSVRNFPQKLYFPQISGGSVTVQATATRVGVNAQKSVEVPCFARGRVPTLQICSVPLIFHAHRDAQEVGSVLSHDRERHIFSALRPDFAS